MKYVLDSCVAVKWFLAEPDSAKAVQLLDDYIRLEHELVAPDVFPVEIAHALSRSERRGVIQPPAGSQHLAAIEQAQNIVPRKILSLMASLKSLGVDHTRHQDFERFRRHAPTIREQGRSWNLQEHIDELTKLGFLMARSDAVRKLNLADRRNKWQMVVPSD